MDSYKWYRSPSHQNSEISVADAHSGYLVSSHRRIALSIALTAAILRIKSTRCTYLRDAAGRAMQWGGYFRNSRENPDLSVSQADSRGEISRA